jgi:hypothetical protein
MNRLVFTEIRKLVLHKLKESGLDKLLWPDRAGKRKSEDDPHITKEDVFNTRVDYLAEMVGSSILYLNRNQHISGEAWAKSYSSSHLRKKLGSKGHKDTYESVMGLFFYRDYIGNSFTKQTDQYTLKEEYRDFVYKVDSLTIHNKKDLPTNGLDKDSRLKIFGSISRDINSYIEINRNSVIGAINTIELHIKRKSNGLPTIDDRFFLRELLEDTKSNVVYSDRLLELKRELEIIKHFTFNNKKRIPVHYTTETADSNKEGTSGRLYNNAGLSSPLDILTLKRPLKKIILSGMDLYDVDINNCHLEILNQFYGMLFGEKNKELNTFCKDYKTIRKKIEQESEVKYTLIKEALLSLTYEGTYLTENQINSDVADKTKIAKEFKKEYGSREYKKKLKRLFIDSKTMKEFGGCIERCINEIHKENKRQGGRVLGVLYKGGKQTGEYYNPAEYIRTTKEKSKLLSHLLQGIEVVCLHHIINTEHPDDLISLHHDGWVVRLRERTPEGYKTNLIHHLKNVTNYKMTQWVEKVGVKLKLPPENKGWGFDLGLTITGLDKKHQIYDLYRTETHKMLNKHIA